MQPINASRQASALYRAHGSAAEAKVAEKIRDCEDAGNAEQAEDWKLIRRAIRELKA